jgi:hypothetical protein
MTSIRSIEQNSKMWAMLGEIAEQKTHCGKHLADWQWKILFIEDLQHEANPAEQLIMPSLDGQRIVACSNWSTRRLTMTQMTELIAHMDEWGLRNEVRFATDKGVIW